MNTGGKKGKVLHHTNFLKKMVNTSYIIKPITEGMQIIDPYLSSSMFNNNQAANCWHSNSNSVQLWLLYGFDLDSIIQIKYNAYHP